MFENIHQDGSAAMSKLVILKLGAGSFEQGFTVTLQIGEEGYRPSTELNGKLPAAPTIPDRYHQWQSAYRGLGLRLRLDKFSTLAMGWD